MYAWLQHGCDDQGRVEIRVPAVAAVFVIIILPRQISRGLGADMKWPVAASAISASSVIAASFWRLLPAFRAAAAKQQARGTNVIVVVRWLNWCNGCKPSGYPWRVQCISISAERDWWRWSCVARAKRRSTAHCAKRSLLSVAVAARK